MRVGRIISKVRSGRGETKILIGGFGQERAERLWIRSKYGHLVEPGARVNFFIPGMICAKAPWSGCTVMVRYSK